MNATCNFCNKDLPVVAEHGRKYACRKCHEKIVAGKEKAKKVQPDIDVVGLFSEMFGFNK